MPQMRSLHIVLFAVTVAVCLCSSAMNAQTTTVINNFDSKVGIKKVNVLLNVSGTACIMAHVGRYDFFQWVVRQPALPGGGADIRTSFQIGRKNNITQSAYVVELGVGWGNYGGGPILRRYPPPLGSRFIDPARFVEVVGYERYKVLQFTRAFGRKFNARESTFGLFFVTDYHFLLNHRELILTTSQSLSRLLVYPGIEVRWYPRNLNIIDSLCFGAQRTFRFLTTVDKSIHQHLFSFKVNFQLYGF